jgi:MoaA/NifB/PqqE/SkfB family radical SAM enzyme
MTQFDYFKSYYMITSRCNLDCTYCVLEDAPDQLRQELDLEGKKALIAHLYALGCRRLTLSGGEALLIGKKPPTDFMALLDFLSRFRSLDPRDNLGVAVYSNGTRLTEAVADAMRGIVDEVSLTIDSTSDDTLTRIGRNRGTYQNYLQNAVGAASQLGRVGIPIKLHTVVAQFNAASIASEVVDILDAVERSGGRLDKWKFYQYMSYDDAPRDRSHAIDKSVFDQVRLGITAALAGRTIDLHFKDNAEMNGSLFNILPYGNAQFMHAGDSWTTSRRTRDLRSYATLAELFRETGIDPTKFNKFHGLPMPSGSGQEAK